MSKPVYIRSKIGLTISANGSTYQVSDPNKIETITTLINNDEWQQALSLAATEAVLTSSDPDSNDEFSDYAGQFPRGLLLKTQRQGGLDKPALLSRLQTLKSFAYLTSNGSLLSYLSSPTRSTTAEWQPLAPEQQQQLCPLRETLFDSLTQFVWEVELSLDLSQFRVVAEGHNLLRLDGESLVVGLPAAYQVDYAAGKAVPLLRDLEPQPLSLHAYHL